MIGKKAKVIGGFRPDELTRGMHQFDEGEIITLVDFKEEKGENEVWYNFEDEEGFTQFLIESEFEFIEEVEGE